MSFKFFKFQLPETGPITRLTFSSSFDFSNTSIENDFVKYRTETPRKCVFRKGPIVMHLHRTDAHSEKEVVVADWEQFCFKDDRYRINIPNANLTTKDEFVATKDVMPNTWGCAHSIIL